MDGAWRVLPYGPHDLLVELQRPSDVAVTVAALRSAGVGAEVVPAERTVLVRWGSATPDPAVLEGVLRAEPPTPDGEGPTPHRVVEIPVVYDGPDLSWLAGATGLSVAEVIERHRAGVYVAAFCGFTPGFAYLIGLDEVLQVPRRATPRPVVPVGSLAVAAQYTAVYPRASPGGWHLIGRTDATMWDLGRARPSLIEPGDEVRFVDRGAPRA